MSFKSQILGDPRVILIGSQAIPQIFSEEFDDSLERMENDTMKAYNSLAQIMECSDMQSIFDVFAEKILQNLVFTDGQSDSGKQVIDITLETFDVFVSSPASCRLMCKSEIIKQLIQNHVVSIKSAYLGRCNLRSCKMIQT